MNIKMFAITFLTMLSTNLMAENHMLLIGGGGEPARDFTIFDTGIDTLSTNLKQSNWKYEVSFNGGHSKTEAILRDKFNTPAKPTTNFSADKFNELLENYKQRILSGNIKSGDQLMVIIDSHGAQQAGSLKTHQISGSGSAKELDDLAGSELVNLDALQELVKLTNERNINLGIVDLSCHSGSTLALKNNAPNTCIITATGPKHYGFAGPTAFTDKFLLNLKPGTNLEEVFLQARSQSTDASYPMISTQEGDEIVASVYKSITPYLYYFNETTDKMTPYVLANSKPELMCQREAEFKGLISQIDRLQTAVRAKNPYADNLKGLLSDYKKAQDSVLNAAIALDKSKAKTIEKFTLPKNSQPIGFFKTEYTWEELLDLKVDDSIADYEKYVKNSTAPKVIAENQAALDYLKAMKAKKEAVIAVKDTFDYKTKTKELVKKMDQTRAIADKIAIQERFFYDDLYRSKKSNSTNNACRKMVF